MTLNHDYEYEDDEEDDGPRYTGHYDPYEDDDFPPEPPAKCPHLPKCNWETINTFLDRCKTCGDETRYPNHNNLPTTTYDNEKGKWNERGT